VTVLNRAVIDICLSYQLFAANQHKPADIVSIFVANKSKMLRLLEDFKIDKGKWCLPLDSLVAFVVSIISFSWPHICCGCAEDEQFEADKAQVMKEIEAL